MKKLLAMTLLTLTSLWSCTPPTVPSQTTSNLQVQQISQMNNRLGRFRLQAHEVIFENGKKLASDPGGAVYLEDVPYVSQGNDNTCGQAVMTMVLQYWGVDIDYQQVVNEGNPLNLATSYEAIQNYLSSKGLKVQGYRGGTLENLVAQIHAGHPVITLLNFGELAQAHYILVVGYNAQRNTVIFHESRSQPYVELELEAFLEMWDNDPVVNLPLFGGNNYKRLMFEVSADENNTGRSGEGGL